MRIWSFQKNLLQRITDRKHPKSVSCISSISWFDMDHATVFFLTQTLADIPADLRWLAAGERARVAAFRFPKRRNDWLLGRWTAKRTLLAFLIQAGQVAPEYPSLDIRSAPDGAPEPFLHDLPAPLSLALSHSGGQGLCAVAPAGFSLGCDLEAVQPRDASLVEDYFRDEEKALVLQAPFEEQPLMATLIWSAKESALKCLRVGLRRDTRSVSVAIADERRPGWNSLTVSCLESSRVFYGWWRDNGGCVLTVAAGRPIHEPVALLV